MNVDVARGIALCQLGYKRPRAGWRTFPNPPVITAHRAEIRSANFVWARLDFVVFTCRTALNYFHLFPLCQRLAEFVDRGYHMYPRNSGGAHRTTAGDRCRVATERPSFTAQSRRRSARRSLPGCAQCRPIPSPGSLSLPEPVRNRGRRLRPIRFSSSPAR